MKKEIRLSDPGGALPLDTSMPRERFDKRIDAGTDFPACSTSEARKSLFLGSHGNALGLIDPMKLREYCQIRSGPPLTGTMRVERELTRTPALINTCTNGVPDEIVRCK